MVRRGPARRLAAGVAMGLIVGAVLTTLRLPATESRATGLPTVAATPSGEAAAGAAAATAAAGVAAPASGPAGEAAPAAGGASMPKSAGTAARPLGATAASDCAGAPADGVRGVTASSIKVGVGIPDLDAFEAALGEQVRVGNQEAYFNAHLAALRRQGLLPVCGRDIAPVFRRYNVLDPAQSRAVCQGFINDDKVFVVLTLFAFGDPNCVTQENRTLMMDHGVALSEELHYAVAGGRLFGLHPPVERQWQIWATWAAASGHLDGHKAGVYFNNSRADTERLVRRYLIDTLRAHGYEPVVVMTNTASALASQADPNDSVAVQRFRTEGVDVVFNLAGSGFMDEARRQGYKPTYLRWGANAVDAGSIGIDPEHFDGAIGIHWSYANNSNSGEAPPARADECMANAEAAGMKPPKRDTLEWNNAMISCDQLTILRFGLGLAGRNLTTDRLALGIQTMVDLPGALVAPVLGYSPTKHWAVSQNREATYSKDCECWRNTGPWVPLYL